MANKPKPFQRKSISIAQEKRVWMMVPAAQLRPGDTVPGVGLLKKVATIGGFNEKKTIQVEGGEGNIKTYKSSEMVQAFVAKHTTNANK